MTDPQCFAEAQQAVIDHILMRDVFHCTPAELAELDEGEIELHWAIREAIRREERREGKRVEYNRSAPKHGSR